MALRKKILVHVGTLGAHIGTKTNTHWYPAKSTEYKLIRTMVSMGYSDAKIASMILK